MLSKEEFQAHIDSGFNIIPVIEDLPVENQTPLTLYSQVSKKNNTFLLESVEGGDRWSQYSIIGFNCSDTIKVTGNVVELGMALESAAQTHLRLCFLGKVIHNGHLCNVSTFLQRRIGKL